MPGIGPGNKARSIHEMFTPQKFPTLYCPYTSILVAQVVIDLATSPPVLAPTITTLERGSANVAMVAFEPQSLGIFNIRYYVADDSLTQDLVRQLIMSKLKAL